MTTFRSEEGLAGLIALGVIPWILWTLRRGLRDKRLPIGRGYVRRAQRPVAFALLLVFYVLAATLMVAIVSDRLFGIDVGNWL